MQTIRVKWLRRDLFVEPLGWIAARLAVLCRFPKMLCGRDPEFFRMHLDQREVKSHINGSVLAVEPYSTTSCEREQFETR